MRRSKRFNIPSLSLPDLSSIDERVFLLHSNDSDSESILALGCLDECKIQHEGEALQQLQAFLDQADDWYFGYLSYDLKNEIEPSLQSENQDELDFPVLHFIRPRMVGVFGAEELVVHHLEGEDPNVLVDLFKDGDLPYVKPGLDLEPQITHAHYLRDVMSLKGHIQQGDIYEVNYCMQFGAEASIQAYSTWRALNEKTRAPFSAYIQADEHHVLCASPERFLRREGNKLISQPIKGTKKRSSDPHKDEQLKLILQRDPKERSENIMITDLVRNDLSKSALKGSVDVEELCEIYSFETVHQMISTVSSRIPEDIPFTQLIRDTFPMGSMTGAPKVRAMELIEDHEQMKRGIYSGCVGYIRPDGDFDFNVVIRSLLYNSQKPYLSAMVGGAITSGSRPEDEYEECLLKVQALLQTLH